MMQFRFRGSPTKTVVKKNDGLPIVNGRKAQRRDSSNVHPTDYYDTNKGHYNNRYYQDSILYHIKNNKLFFIVVIPAL